MRTYSTNWETSLKSNNNIFIAIPALNEIDLLNTVSDAYSKADNPQSIFIGVCNQKTNANFEDFSKFENVEVVENSSQKIRGIGLARLESLWLWSGQTYIMQIDAHTRFVDSWDSKIITWHKQLSSINGKCVISQRPCAFTKNESGDTKFDENIPSVEKLRRFQILDAIEKITKKDISIEERKLVSDSIEHNFVEEDFVEHYCVAGGFMFSDYRFFMDVLPDPRIVFFGEEHIMPIRAMSSGYSIYAVKDRIIYTLEKTSDYMSSKEASLNWHNIYSMDSVETSYLHFIDAYLNPLLGLEFGYYGAADEKSYDEYVDKFDFDYRNIEGIFHYD